MTLDLPLKDIEKRKAERHADVWADIGVSLHTAECQKTQLCKQLLEGILDANFFKILHSKWPKLVPTIHLHYSWF